MPFGAAWFTEVFRENSNSCCTVFGPGVPLDLFNLESTISASQEDQLWLVLFQLAVPGLNLGGGKVGRY